MKTLSHIYEYLNSQGIVATRVAHLPSVLDTIGGGSSVVWSSHALQLTHHSALTSTQESMSLASMAAVHQLNLVPDVSILDLCAAPGMKGLYANVTTPGIHYTANDISKDRLMRLKRLFSNHNVTYTRLTNIDARFADKFYESKSFDRIIIDAPCSGEGVILGGDDKLLYTWSAAKVKRLQQIQIKIVKSAWNLLKPGGRLVYATCTLNKNENERVIKKALGVELAVTTSELSTESLQSLKHAEAWRVLPSQNSIGFFISALEKSKMLHLD